MTVNRICIYDSYVIMCCLAPTHWFNMNSLLIKQTNITLLISLCLYVQEHVLCVKF